MRDGFLLCLTAPTAFFLGAITAGGALRALSWLREARHYLPMLLTVGGALGITVGTMAGFLGHAVCTRSPRTAAAGGALAGALGALSFGRFSGASQASESLLRTAAVGALLVGPPWVAYVAVRSRGRSGLALIPVTWAWVALAGAGVVTWEVLF
jgi:hypothetical protein